MVDGFFDARYNQSIEKRQQWCNGILVDEEHSGHKDVETAGKQKRQSSVPVGFDPGRTVLLVRVGEGAHEVHTSIQVSLHFARM